MDTLLGFIPLGRKEAAQKGHSPVEHNRRKAVFKNYRCYGLPFMEQTHSNQLLLKPFFLNPLRAFIEKEGKLDDGTCVH